MSEGTRSTGTRPEITREETLRIAHLARLALTAAEVEAYTGQLNAILGYIEALQQIDVSGVEPTAHAQLRPTPLRPDVVTPSLSVEEALSQAPRKDGPGFVVPKVV